MCHIFLGLSTISTARAAAARIPKVKGSRRTGVDTLKRNDPIQHERGLTVLMRRTASGVPDHSRIHLSSVELSCKTPELVMFRGRGSLPCAFDNLIPVAGLRRMTPSRTA